jgi:K+-sensing histidine kinase KdpD
VTAARDSAWSHCVAPSLYSAGAQVSFALQQAHAISVERWHLERAAEAERAKREAGSTFLAVISHEMRTVRRRAVSVRAWRDAGTPSR